MNYDCSALLSNLERLEALRQTGLFGTPSEEAFRRLNELATKALNAPISIFSLIGERSQFFKSASGFEITPENNEVPIDISVCQYSLHGRPLSIADTLGHPDFSENPAVKGLNIRGYLGIPVITKSGHAIGAVCVIDHKERVWSDKEISILEHITASFISEIELREAIRKAESEAKLREEFIAVASHELKNPLSALRMEAQILKKKLENKSLNEEDLPQLLTSFERQTWRMNILIDDMTDSARLSSGNFTISREKLDLDNLIQDVAHSLEDKIAGTGCSLKLKLTSEVSGLWDPLRITQVLSNLILNATKHAPGSIIEIQLEKISDKALLSIKDNGPGIPEKMQAKLFQKYSRGEMVRPGLGLGLFISRQLIEQHGGWIELKSEAGKGTEFIINLPLK